MSARSEAWTLALEGIQDLEEETICALRRLVIGVLSK